MIRSVRNEYEPDWVSPPGATLLETLAARGMTQKELAQRTGHSPKLINDIIKGAAPITPTTAVRLEYALGIPAGFWTNRERQHRDAQARVAQKRRLKSSVDWLRDVPLHSMVKLGWITSFDDKTRQLEEVLNFFGAASPRQVDELWRAKATAFRQSRAYRAKPIAVAAWLRMAEIDAVRIDCAPYRESGFRRALESIRPLTLEPADVFEPELKRLCAEAGVAMVFVRELPAIRTWGATRWLTPTKALIQLSLRYRSDDHLWFSFHHEAGHILLHGKRDFFLESDGERDENETEADRFAADYLIPPAKLGQFVRRGCFTKAAVRRFASVVGIAPGIVVGRLQHDGHIRPSAHNDLKRRLDWA